MERSITLRIVPLLPVEPQRLITEQEAAVGKLFAAHKGSSVRSHGLQASLVQNKLSSFKTCITLFWQFVPDIFLRGQNDSESDVTIGNFRMERTQGVGVPGTTHLWVFTGCSLFQTQAMFLGAKAKLYAPDSKDPYVERPQ